MNSLFEIKSVHRAGELLSLSGDILKGVIQENDSGTTWNGKRFKVTKLDTPTGEVGRATIGMRVTLVVKNLVEYDVRPGDRLYLE